MTDELRPAVVEELFAATVDPDLSEDHLRELMYNASDAERSAVAERHAQLADISSRKAYGLARALDMVGARIGHGSLGALLKTCEPGLRERVLGVLFGSGWTEAEIGLPAPPPSADRS